MERAQKVSRNWKTGQNCEIYDHAKKQWVDGEVVGVFKDEDGEWVKVQYQHYGRRRTVEMTSDDPDLRHDHSKQEGVSEWEVGAQCELFSRLDGKWMEGEIIHIFSDSVGEWIRVQCGQHIREVFENEVEHDVRPRGTCDVRVSFDDIKKIKNMTAKYPTMALVLNRVFSTSYQLGKDDITKSYLCP